MIKSIFWQIMKCPLFEKLRDKELCGRECLWNCCNKFQKIPYRVWDGKRRDLKDYLHLYSRLCDGRARISCSYLCTDEDDDGDASYFVFVLRLEYWAYSQAEADKYRKKLLESVKEVEELMDSINKKINFHFGVEYYFEPKLDY